MARHLQEKYREYGRRKSQPFRYLVDQGKIVIKIERGENNNESHWQALLHHNAEQIHNGDVNVCVGNQVRLRMYVVALVCSICQAFPLFSPSEIVYIRAL